MDSTLQSINPFTNNLDFVPRLRTPVEPDNLRVFKLKPKISIDELLGILKAQCKADTQGNYSVDFPGDHLEKSTISKIDYLKLKSTDIIFIEVRERESTWILKTKDLRVGANDRSEEQMMVEDKEEKKEIISLRVLILVLEVFLS